MGGGCGSEAAGGSGSHEQSNDTMSRGGCGGGSRARRGSKENSGANTTTSMTTSSENQSIVSAQQQILDRLGSIESRITNLEQSIGVKPSSETTQAEENGKEERAEQKAYDEGFQKVANKRDLQDGDLLRVDSEGKPILLSMVNGKVYAMHAICSHQGAPLEEGTLRGHNLTCPWHYAVFDVQNGKVVETPVPATDLKSYPVKVDEDTGDIMVKLDRRGNKSGNAPAITTTAGGATMLQQQKQKQEQRRSSTGEPRNRLCTECQESMALPMMQQKQQLQEEQRRAAGTDGERKKRLFYFTLSLLGKERSQGTNIMTFKFSKRNEREGEGENVSEKMLLNYVAGQYGVFDLGVKNDPEGSSRPFSIASSPTEDILLISTRVRETRYKEKLSSLEIGDKINVFGPYGKFVLHDDYSKPAVFISGGIGVTPFRSMVKYATDEQLPLKIIMFDSNRNEENILYKNEFDEWAKINRNLHIVYTITEDDDKEERRKMMEKEERDYNNATLFPSPSEWREERGRISRQMLTKYLNGNEIDKSIFYICGPPGMVKAIQKLLQEDLQIPEERIKVEKFTGY